MKKTIKYIYLSVLSTIAFTVVSCEDLKFGNEFLQKPPSSDVTIDTVFSSAEYARRMLWYSYQNMPFGLETPGYGTAMHLSTQEALTDLNQSTLTYSKVNKFFYTGNYNAKEQQAENGIVRYTPPTWTAIRNAWLVINNIDRVLDMETSEKSRLKAEAKVVIAIYYFNYFRNFGALPIIDHPLSAEEDMPPRATLQETVDFMIKLLDEAIACNEFPWALPADERANWFGRMTKASAMGLKAKILLFAASPLFNDDQPYHQGEAATQKMVWFGNYDKNRWKLVIDACKDFFDALDSNGFYKLVEKDEAASVYAGYKNEYRYAFRAGYFDRGTTESLIATGHNGVWTTSNCKIGEGTRWGAHNPTLEYLDMFETADGEKLDWDALRAEHKDIFRNRDPRMYETLLVHGDEFRGRPLDLIEAKPGDEKNYPKGANWGSPWIVDVRSLRSGFGSRKWSLDRDYGGEFKNHIVQWPFLRLAEMYLIYAEAINEYNGGPTSLAYAQVDRVRDRVGLKPMKQGLNQEQFREEVLRERACEFGWEESRLYDLNRWKRADIFSKSTHELHLYRHKDTKQLEYFVKDMNETDVKRKFWEPNGFDNKWFLSAFPANEVNKGYGLIQNPGWE